MLSSQPVWAFIVARVGNRAKSRLAGALSTDQRRQLALAMLSDVVEVCTRAHGPIAGALAVVDELDARVIVERAGGIALADPGAGDMNAAVRAGLRAVRQFGAVTAIVVPGDVPLIATSDFEALLEAPGQAQRAVVIGASHDGVGTNALLVRPLDVIVPVFGPPSLQRHVQAGLAAGAVTLVQPDLGLALDVDTPDDLNALLSAHPGRHTEAALAELLVRN